MIYYIIRYYYIVPQGGGGAEIPPIPCINIKFWSGLEIRVRACVQRLF